MRTAAMSDGMGIDSIDIIIIVKELAMMIEHTSAMINRKTSSSKHDSQTNHNSVLHRPIIINRRSVKSRRRPRQGNYAIREEDDDDLSFLGIALRVASVLFIVCVAMYVMMWRYFSSEVSYQKYQSHYEKKGDLNFIAESGAKHTSTAAENIFEPVKEIDIKEFLPDEVTGDCFDVVNILPTFQDELGSDIGDTNELSNEHKDILIFIRRVKAIRAEFSATYGGENKARAMLARGINSFKKETEDIFMKLKERSTITQTTETLYHSGIPINIIHTANRILEAHKEKRPFKIAFAGYSVTVGRGNYFHQSYPFVLEKIIKEPMKLLGVELEVRNAAIGGIPSFPYGWCLQNFLGADADVVSWDYSMNESGGVSAGIEAYLRQTLMMKHKPMLIVKDTHMASKRRDVVRHYVENGLLRDPVIINSDPAAEPFLKDDEESRPPGFQKWREFGAPKGAPGQARHHPSVKEHELIGWILAMHFLAALEVTADTLMRNVDLHDSSQNADIQSIKLPPPINLPLPNSPASSLLFGRPDQNIDRIDEWTMNHISCRTTYDPILNGTLKEIVTSGLADEIDLMLPKSEMIFKDGWVLDYGEGEKKAKRKLQPYDLGYIDSKKAYYGLPMSNSLKMWLPWDGFQGSIPQSGNLRGKHNNTYSSETIASTWFQSLVLCEVNEERGEGECRLDKNLDITVGGEKVSDVTYIDAVGVSYLAKTICVDVSIPAEAKISKSIPNQKIGLAVEVKVKGHVQLKNGPCSISHIIWEEKSLR